MPVLKNFMEELVLDRMKGILADVDMCTCEKCLMDVAAIALNNLPPKYVVTEQGRVYSKVNFMGCQYDADVISAIMQAAAQVKKQPRH